MAMGLGIVAVISQCVGAGDYMQVDYYAKKLLKWNYTAMAISNITILVCLPLIIKLYGLSDETASMASLIITINCGCAIVLWPISFSLPNVLRASSDVTYTMVVGVASMWIFRIGCAVLMGKTLGMGLVGVWIAMIIDWAVRSICFILRYRSGKWKNTTIA
jgi:Na+-driven multidrug efflux pump